MSLLPSRSLLLVSLAAAVASAAPAVTTNRGGQWDHVGPHNIFDDKHGNGEAGTLADAASPFSNPDIIYTGGSNNGASSGVLKSTDMGRTWVKSSAGLFDTRVYGVFLYPGTEDHVLVGTPTGVYESVDGAASWKLIPKTSGFGLCRSFRNGTIEGKHSVLGGCAAGVANIPIEKGGRWNLVKSTHGDWSTPLSIADEGDTTVVAGCLSGIAVLGTITSVTGADWTLLENVPCINVAIDPNDKDHFLYSKDKNPYVFESTDGGKTTRNISNSVYPYYVAIDRKGWFYTGAEAGSYRSMDGGKTWGAYAVHMQLRAGYNNTRVQHDYQRISMDFAGGVALPADQGLFIPPSEANKGNVADLTLINANGNMSNNIAITLAVSPGDGTSPGRFLVMTVWDWNVIASWNSGKNWPATPCKYWDAVGCQGAPAAIGEGGSATAMGMSNHVVLLHYNTIYYSDRGGKNTTHLKLPPSAIDHNSELVYTRIKGSRSEPDGNLFTVMTMSTSDARRYKYAMLPEDFLGDEDADEEDRRGGDGDGDGDKNGDADEDKGRLQYSPFGEIRDEKVESVWKSWERPAATPPPPPCSAEPRSWCCQLETTGEVCEQSGSYQMLARICAAYSRNGIDCDNCPGHESCREGGELAVGNADADGRAVFVLKSADFGHNWTWTQFPPHLHDASVIAVDPTDASRIFAIAGAGLATSTDKGETWSAIIKADGLTPGVSSLLIKDSTTMVALRRSQVPLRSQDGGKSWAAITDPLVAKFSTPGYTRAGSWSWSGKTLELHGRDPDAASRGEYAGFVLKSQDGGTTFTDETGDIVTQRVSSGRWYQKDFYLTTSGEGILLKTNFDE